MEFNELVVQKTEELAKFLGKEFSVGHRNGYPIVKLGNVGSMSVVLMYTDRSFDKYLLNFKCHPDNRANFNVKFDNLSSAILSTYYMGITYNTEESLSLL